MGFPSPNTASDPKLEMPPEPKRCHAPGVPRGPPPERQTRRAYCPACVRTKYRQNIVRALSGLFQGIVRFWPSYSQNIARVSPKHRQGIVGVPTGYRKGITRISPGHRQDILREYPGRRQSIVGVPPIFGTHSYAPHDFFSRMSSVRAR